MCSVEDWLSEVGWHSSQKTTHVHEAGKVIFDHPHSCHERQGDHCECSLHHQSSAGKLVDDTTPAYNAL